MKKSRARIQKAAIRAEIFEAAVILNETGKIIHARFIKDLISVPSKINDRVNLRLIQELRLDQKKYGEIRVSIV